MPRIGRPWKRASDGKWYAKIDGVLTCLGTNEKLAHKEFHRLKGRSAPVIKHGDQIRIEELSQAFLDWCRSNKSAATADWYETALRSFVETIETGTLAAEILPAHITAWIDNPALKWSANTRRGYASAVQRAFRWAHRQRLIASNPVADVEKPAATSRESVLSPEAIKNLQSETVGKPWIADVVTALLETGARPQEIRKLEARHVDLENGVWVLPRSEAKGKRKARVIVLTPSMLELSKRLCADHPDGPIFRNSRGKPWSSSAIRQWFWRRQGKHGLPDDLCAYLSRHTYVTQSLERGVDAVTLAELVGHADTRMISRVYSHLRLEHLKAAAIKASGAEKETSSDR